MATELTSAPRYIVQANGDLQTTEDNLYHSTSPSWVVCFIPFDEPASSYTSSLSDAMKVKKPIVIQNDCVSVTITRSKSSFIKTANLSLKISDIYFQNAVATGDRVFIWMSNHQEDMDEIAGRLNGNLGGSLNDWSSGLKFEGRIVNIGSMDEMSINGQRTLVQSISCQSFVELSSSLYHTYLQRGALDLFTSTPSGINSVTNGQVVEQKFNDQALRSALGNAALHFFDIFQTGQMQTPDQIISNLIILTMGIPNDKQSINIIAGTSKQTALGTPNDAIRVPREVTTILGKPKANYLWEIYNVYLGRQRYGNRGGSIWEQFSPEIDETKIDPNSPKDNVFYFSPYRLKGVVPYIPPAWNNTPIWSVWNQYLHPLLNEMYTCLRINRHNQILPSVIVREQPWSTGLFNYLQNGLPMKDVQTSTNETDQNNKKTKTKKKGIPPRKIILKNTEPMLTENLSRTFFHNLPRWVIDPSMLRSVDLSCSEGDRLNFVQVFSKMAGYEALGADPQSTESLKHGQLNAGNFVIDQKDIQRHGLKAFVAETDYDALIKTGKDVGTVKAPILTGAKDAASARFIGNRTVQYKTNDSSSILYKGGSRSWRNNNPGNIRMSDFAISKGAIGSDGDFAIFPTYEIGYAAIGDLLSGPAYKDLTVYQAIRKYAPPTENNTANYQNQVKKYTGLDINRKISSLSPMELTRVTDAIQRVEGYIVGNVEEITGEESVVFTVSTSTHNDDKSALAGSSAPLWAKILADWKFNGHLKLKGTVRTAGIVEPICEGDNLEVNDIVLHIDSITFQGNLDSGGRKSFNTFINLSNGIMAHNLNEKDAPTYPVHLSIRPESLDVRGYTEIQNRAYDERRGSNGELTRGSDV
jgi:hypothetical protein